MPELPEVETIVRLLGNKLINQKFSHIDFRLEKCLKGSKESFLDALEKRKIVKVGRRGKNIVFTLSGGMVMLIHLGMSGRLRFVSASQPEEKHTHAIFSFACHPFQLRFVDPRQFGRITVEKKEEEKDPASLASLGPEPLEISAKEFILRVTQKHRAIKPLLLDQHFLAGVGNIYADESLHRARIHPLRRADSLGKDELLRLYHALLSILRKAIRAGGSSVRTYVDASGSRGKFQDSLRVYSREGKSCRVCGTPIVRGHVGGRSSYYCPRCQPRVEPPKEKNHGKLIA